MMSWDRLMNLVGFTGWGGYNIQQRYFVNNFHVGTENEGIVDSMDLPKMEI